MLADADIDRAANGIAWGGGMFNSGQVCISVERVYVEAPVYDEFVAKLTANVRNIKQGQEESGFKYDTGAMATAAQRDIVERHVKEAVDAGARVLTGGKPTGVGTFFEPTVLADVTPPTMTCIAEETFGPTLPVVKVADEEEAIRLANDSQYGLSATVWTGDVERGRAGGPTTGVRCGQHQRRAGQRVLPVAADGRVEELGRRLSLRRCQRSDQVLPPAGHHRAEGADAEVRVDVVLVVEATGPARDGGDACDGR